MDKPQMAVVTGRSNDIGKEIALMLARNGFKTYATMRNLAKSSELRIIAEKEVLPMKIVQLDVTEDNSKKCNQIDN